MLTFALQAGLALTEMVGVYTGFPGYSAPAPIQLMMKFHNVTATVGMTGGKVESTTRVKNLSDSTAKVEMRIPICVRRLPETALLVGMRGSWDEKAIDFRFAGYGDRVQRDQGLISYDGFFVATVEVRAKGEHTLKANYVHGLASMYDADLQTFAYDTRFVSAWAGGSIASINVSLKYDKLPSGESTVYMVDRAQPKGWQYGVGHGANQGGAYFGLREHVISQSELTKAPMQFSYYTPR